MDDGVLDLVTAMGGSISAEHGIGIAKRAAFERSASSADLAAMSAIKQALDPRAILNPGVLIAPMTSSEHVLVGAVVSLSGRYTFQGRLAGAGSATGRGRRSEQRRGSPRGSNCPS